MLGRHWLWMVLAGLRSLGAAADEVAVGEVAAGAPSVVAGPPSDVSVTVYRAPLRNSGSMSLNQLGGFALVSETRTVRLAAGENRLRFEGVADGIEPASVIVAGLPGILEKNREGQLLSPSALIAAAVGKPVVFVRSNAKTGKSEALPGTIVSDADGGVVFKTAQGIEALRCSGLAETVEFTSTELSALPTLSVLVRSAQATLATVTLSYLARGFDWSADYVATLSPDGKTLDLGAWVTLANGNGVGFPKARTQVVAGRVNRESGAVEPIDIGSPILAQCWPRGSTSDTPPQSQLQGASPLGFGLLYAPMDARRQMMALAAPAAMQEFAQKVVEEQLGDLKLYRVPDRTTVAARQSKQVRLMDRTAIAVNTVYQADLGADEPERSTPAVKLLRTQNDAAHHLGLPLPSGRVAVFTDRGGASLLLHESAMRDLAVDEEVEIDLGESADVQVKTVKGEVSVDSAHAHISERVQISNARAAGIQFELRLALAPGARVMRADHALAFKNGRPIFRLSIPAGETATLSYQIDSAVRHLVPR
jgi:hypothetical protein